MRKGDEVQEGEHRFVRGTSCDVEGVELLDEKDRSEGESEDDGCAGGDAGGILQAVSGSKEVYGGYLQIV